MLKKITTREDLLPYVDKQGLKSPMPLQAILLTDNKIDVALKSISDASFGKISNEEHRDCLRRILSMGFDHILTTNYSYEIEIASQEGTNITQSKVVSMQRFLRDNGIKQAEPKYLLHTYNEVKYLDSVNKVWHIHGEARKQSSMVLGHYYYGNLLCRIKELADSRGRKYHSAEKYGRDFEVKSWIDAFILGDIYVLGLDYNLAEIDLWWLLNRKFNEKANHGNVYFLEPKPTNKLYSIDERLELIKVFIGKENVMDFDMVVPSNDEDKSAFYAEFYGKSLDKISKLMIDNQNLS
ncbi:MAG: hypothetical protein ACI4MQ_06215 [Candidatus Coproplasma sp.]